MLDTIVLYALLTTALYYLGARATITSWLWSRYPRKLAVFADCPSCTGFWYGVLVAATFRLPAFSLQGDSWYTPIVVGLCSMVWTPCVAALMHACFERLGDAVPEPEPPPVKPWMELP
jgi:hypothetical protein